MVGSVRTPSDTNSPSVLPEALATLLTKVEAASGPDREIDAAIFCTVLHPDLRPDTVTPGRVWVPDREKPQLTGYIDTEHYTAYIDSAVALVETLLPGASWMTARPPEKTGRAVIVHELVHEDEATAATPALALIAALLKALQAHSSDEGNPVTSPRATSNEKQPNPTPNRDEL